MLFYHKKKNMLVSYFCALIRFLTIDKVLKTICHPLQRIIMLINESGEGAERKTIKSRCLWEGRLKGAPVAYWQNTFAGHLLFVCCLVQVTHHFVNCLTKIGTVQILFVTTWNIPLLSLTAVQHWVRPRLLNILKLFMFGSNIYRDSIANSLISW